MAPAYARSLTATFSMAESLSEVARRHAPDVVAAGQRLPACHPGGAAGDCAGAA